MLTCNSLYEHTVYRNNVTTIMSVTEWNRKERRRSNLENVELQWKFIHERILEN